MAALYELLRGFQAADDQRHGDLLRDVLRDDPNAVYGGLLRVLLRLVFLLYAEDRSLLSNDEVYQKYYSVIGLFERLREDAGRYADTMDHRYGAWAQLLTLFRLVYDGGRHGGMNLLARKGYSYVWDDELNRYYVAEEARAIAARLVEGPKWYADGPQIGNFKGAAEDPTHPDHRLALLLAGADLTKLPLIDRSAILDLLTAGFAEPDRPANAPDIAALQERLFGASAALQQIAPGEPGKSILETYREIIDSDAFRAAAGRIAASYAW